MLRCQVFSLALREYQQHRDVRAGNEVVVNHPRPGALAATGHGNANFSEPARAFHHIAHFGVLEEVPLEPGVIVVFEEFGDPPGERRRLDEDHVAKVRQ